MESGDGGSRRRRSASDEKVDSPNLRDFLRVKEDNDGPNLTGSKRPSPAQVNRTLLDIIRGDPNCGSENRKSWKVFRDMLRLRRAGAAWTSTIPIPACYIPIHNANRMISRRNSTRFPASNSEDQSTRSELSSSSSFAINGGENQNSAGLSSMPSNRAMMMRRNSSRIPSPSAGGFGRRAEVSAPFNTSESTAVESADLEAEQEEEEESGGETGAEEGEEPVARMSLMALLAETDRQMGFDGATYVMEDDEEDEEEEEEQSGGVEYNDCCVCMVRHKGAALIPCGHTFCRLCSRELWVQRGNCPLCNGFILEILDIF